MISSRASQGRAVFSLPPKLALIVLAVALLGLLTAYFGLRRLLVERRPLAGGGGLLLGLALLAGAGATIAALANLYTYQRLTAESLVATLTVRSYAPQDHVVTLTTADGARREFSVAGDEVQIDARILRWQGPALWFGLHTLFRLDRLAGRFAAAERERAGPRSVHPLSDNPGLDLWALARRFERWLPWVDAVYGSAVYLPLADGARYEITITASGLAARPLNPAAERALRQWR